MHPPKIKYHCIHIHAFHQCNHTKNHSNIYSNPMDPIKNQIQSNLQIECEYSINNHKSTKLNQQPSQHPTDNDLCLVKEPCRNRDDFKPTSGYSFVLLSTLDQENRRKAILCGSGENIIYVIVDEITDIQITFKSN
eukprot:427744_1